MFTPTPTLHHELRAHINRSGFVLMLFVCAAVLIASSPIVGQKATVTRIQFTEKPVHEAQDAIKLAFKIVGASDKRVRIAVSGQADHVVARRSRSLVATNMSSLSICSKDQIGSPLLSS